MKTTFRDKSEARAGEPIPVLVRINMRPTHAAPAQEFGLELFNTRLSPQFFPVGYSDSPGYLRSIMREDLPRFFRLQLFHDRKQFSRGFFRREQFGGINSAREWG